MALLRFLVAIGLLAAPGSAQTAALHGRVTDESGAVVPGATVTVTGSTGTPTTAVTASDGSYTLVALSAGSYTVQASAPGLMLRQPPQLTLRAGSQTLNLVLNVAAEKQRVTVEDSTGPAVGTDAANNASAVVLRGTDLDALSDNPDDLAADLQALAGPAAGPNGGSIFIDGFSGGELPPKEAIREIRINQNPFSPEYDKLGFGRIEIFTKPGSDKFHGSVGYNFANDVWNSRNAYAAEKAPFRLNELRSAFAGPIGKRASFNIVLIREWVDNGNAVNGVTLNPQTLAATPFTDTPVAQLRRTGVTPRLDYQLSTNHTLTVRYAYNRDDVRNAGTGGFNLVSQGYHYDAPAQTAQLTDTAVLSTNVINEMRFQYFRPETVSQANIPGDALQVLGAFNGGGNPIGRSTDTQNTYEFQNYTSVVRGVHTWRFGVRLRDAADANVSPQNFAGTFTFSGGLAPELNANNQPVLDATGQPVMVDITSIESYRRTLLFEQMGTPAAQIRQLGGGASQFSISTGNPLVAGSQFDVGAFVGDEWKARPNLTLSLGLRYETQTNIHDGRDFAPRIGVAWAPGGGSGKQRAKSVIRAGFGMFYDRFSLANVLTARRYNGAVEQQYVIANPDFFPAVPPVLSLPGPVLSSTIQEISSTLRAPYLVQSAVAFERQVPRNTTVAITFANSHGLHLLRSQDINAPLPGTYVASLPGSGVFPLGRPGAVVLMESAGLYNQDQLIVNVNSRLSSGISLNGSYMYNRAMSNTDGLGTFPSNPYSMAGEYGPAATDMHHRVFLGGTIEPKWGIRFNPLLTANTGPPFDITAGNDLYGDTLFNARPGIAASPGKAGLIATRYGLLDPSPAPGETVIPRNYGRGPGQIMLNMRIAKTFSFGPSREGGSGAPTTGGGPGGGGGPRGAPTSPFSTGAAGQAAPPASNRRYSATISMYIRNITNHNNPGPIIGDITSSLFGQANQPAGTGNGIFSESANNRRLELQTRFTF
ncbi:MAG TPA: carboxypeptidase regulatory-like domain-containing protein [Bryobacteraceae bacterium]|nr:carboxypeptidase regulatory-like domain-containing protein [Bryobacteraceae bacterium]